jgi:DMSO/TMAO reductase YedYZ molybdopterin-dependent catalytic subunit
MDDDGISEIQDRSKTSEYRGGGSYFMNRRGFLQLVGATGVAVLASSCNRVNSVVGTLLSPTSLIRFPEKTEMILLTDRPPQLETPLHYFRQDLTPNEAFFVRWHLEGIPTSVDLRTFRLNLSGHVRRPLQLSVDDLRSQFEPISIVAVNQMDRCFTEIHFGSCPSEVRSRGRLIQWA